MITPFYRYLNSLLSLLSISSINSHVDGFQYLFTKRVKIDLRDRQVKQRAAAVRDGALLGEGLAA
jgi:hypothetical protein